MQLLIVATVSRFTSLWPRWQQRNRDEGRQLTGAPGCCCHQVHLLNLTLRQEGVEEGGKTAKEEGRRERELGGEEREEWPDRKTKRGKGVKIKKEAYVCAP